MVDGEPRRQIPPSTIPPSVPLVPSVSFVHAAATRATETATAPSLIHLRIEVPPSRTGASAGFLSLLRERQGSRVAGSVPTRSPPGGVPLPGPDLGTSSP